MIVNPASFGLDLEHHNTLPNLGPSLRNSCSQFVPDMTGVPIGRAFLKKRFVHHVLKHAQNPITDRSGPWLLNEDRKATGADCEKTKQQRLYRASDMQQSAASHSRGSSSENIRISQPTQEDFLPIKHPSHELSPRWASGKVDPFGETIPAIRLRSFEGLSTCGSWGSENTASPSASIPLDQYSWPLSRASSGAESVAPRIRSTPYRPLRTKSLDRLKQKLQPHLSRSHSAPASLG